MRTALRRMFERLQQFRVVEDGVAAVEFALILPILFVLYIGSVEASALISMDRRVQSVSGSLGDLVARADTTLTAATLTDYFHAAGSMMTPYPIDGLKQTVTQVEVRADGKAYVVWSKQCVREATGQDTCGTSASYPDNSVYDLAEPMKIIAQTNRYVIVAEATISYLPLYGLVLNKPISLYRQNFFMPRFGGTITVQ